MIRDNTPGTGRNQPAVKSISRAARILLCLDKGFSTVTDIASCCKLSKSTAHRLLRALEETHIVSQDPLKHRYYLGPVITRLSTEQQNTHEYLILHSVEEMKRLADIAEETVTLAVMSGIQYVHLYEILSKHDLRVIEEGKRVRVLFAGATTKVLLSQLNDEELVIAVKNIRITPVTGNTITDKDLLMTQVKKIRRQGYAISKGEAIEGALCISAPIRDYIIPAALSIVGPEDRLQPGVARLTEELQASASRISNTMAEIVKTKETAVNT